MKQIHGGYWQFLADDNFDASIFEAGKELIEDLQELEWAPCGNCQETRIGISLEQGLCLLCRKDKRHRKTYAPGNDLTPTPAPECLRRLTPIEKLAISIICPSISIYCELHKHLLRARDTASACTRISRVLQQLFLASLGTCKSLF